MRKYALFSSIFVLILFAFNFNVNFASALVPGCTLPGQAYSVTTGQACGSSSVIVCAPGDLFSSVTGQPCSTTPVSSGVFTQNLTIGSRGSEVGALQQILKDEGYYLGKIDSNYGKRTARAVKEFQDDNDLSVTGVVDADTRAVLNSFPISTNPVSSSTVNLSYIQSGAKFKFSLSSNNLFDKVVGSTDCSNSEVQISSLRGSESCGSFKVALRPTTGIEYLVELNSKDSNVHYVNLKTDIYFQGSFIGTGSVRVPVYPVNTNSNSPVISGVKGPQMLDVNQQGTWGVTASDPSGGTLSYSVVWGDEVYAAPTLNSTSQYPRYQSATLTHTYSQAGNYTPSFTVTNTSGQSAQASLSVDVGGVTTSPSITLLSPNGGETWTKGTTQTIQWQDNMPYPPCPQGQSGTVTNCLYAQRLYDITLEPYDTPCTTNPCIITSGRLTLSIAKGVQGLGYNWSVGAVTNYYGAAIAPDGAYTIQACQTGTTICDSSDNYFKIISGGGTNSFPIITKTGFINPTNVTVGQSASFRWYATDADNDDLSWGVDWGEGIGTMGTCQVNPPKGTGKNWNYTASYTWNTAGTYLVKVSVNDCKGGTAETSFRVNVGGVSNTGIVVALLDAASPVSTTLNPGQLGAVFSKIKLSNNSGNNVTLNNIQLSSDTIFADKFIQNIKIFNGSTQVGSTASNVTWNGDYYYLWIPVTLTLPANTSTVLTLTADVLTVTNLGVTMHLGIAGLNFNSPGATTTGLPVYGNNMTISGSTTPLIITTSSPLPNAKVGTNYSAFFSATGNTTDPQFWTVMDSSLPPEIFWSNNTSCNGACSLMGTFKSPGTYTFTLRVTAGSQTATKQFTLTVDLVSGCLGGPVGCVKISSLSPASGPVGTNVTIYGSGFIVPLNCYPNVCDPIPGSGNTINFGNGVIRDVYSYDGTSLTFQVPSSLTPACYYSQPACKIATVITQPGVYDISVTNANGTSNKLNLTVTSSTSSLTITTSSPLPNAKVGTRYDTTILASGGTGDYNWQIFSGSLPPGLSLFPGFACYTYPCPREAPISGTPTSAGTYIFTIQVSDGGVKMPNKQFILTVDPANSQPLALNVYRDSSSPGGYINPGDKNAELFQVVINATGQNAVIKQLNVGLVGTAVPYLSNIQAYDSGTSVGTLSNLVNTSSWYYTANINVSGLTIPVGSSKVVSIRGDVSSSVWAGTTSCTSCTKWMWLTLDNITTDPLPSSISSLPVNGNQVTVPFISTISRSILNSGSLSANVINSTANSSTNEQILGTGSFHFIQFLEEGSRGNEVMELQKYLNNRGYNAGALDGVFGSKVKAALIKFQIDNNLKSDGIVGYEMRTFLNR